MQQLEAKIESMKKQSEKKKTAFMTLFLEKTKFAQRFYEKYKLRFTTSEMSKCTVAELENVGKHKIELRRIARRDRAAAVAIQKMWRGYSTRKLFVVLLAEYRRVRTGAVKTIAAIWRGWSTRKHIRERAQKRLHWAVITIQRVTRGSVVVLMFNVARLHPAKECL